MERMTQFRKALGNCLLEQATIVGIQKKNEGDFIKAIRGRLSAAEASKIEHFQKTIADALTRLKKVEQLYSEELDKVLASERTEYSRLANIYQYLDSSEFDDRYTSALSEANLSKDETDMFTAYFLADGPFRDIEDLDLAITTATLGNPSRDMTDHLLRRAIDMGSVDSAVTIAQLQKITLSEQQVDALLFTCIFGGQSIKEAIRAARLGCSPVALNMLALAMLNEPPGEDEVGEYIAITDGTETSE